jgi:hypothetical protein
MAANAEALATALARVTVEKRAEDAGDALT